MKKLVLLALLGLVTSTGAQAQTLPTLPNSSFDIWTLDIPGGPMSWTRSDQIYDFIGIPVSNSVTPTSDAHSGTAAVLMQGKAIAGTFYEPYLKLGSCQPFNPTVRQGMAIAARPAALQFWYKYTGAATVDTTDATITLFAGATQQLVGQGMVRMVPDASSATYRLGQAVIQYSSATVQPDWFQITFRGNARSLTGKFYLDDVSLSNTVTSAAEAKLQHAVSVHPNPSSTGEFVLRADTAPDLARAPYTVSDATGRIIRSEQATAGTGNRLIDLRGQPAGVYILHLNTSQGTLVRRLVVR